MNNPYSRTKTVAVLNKGEDCSPSLLDSRPAANIETKTFELKPPEVIQAHRIFDRYGAYGNDNFESENTAVRDQALQKMKYDIGSKIMEYVSSIEKDLHRPPTHFLLAFEQPEFKRLGLRGDAEEIRWRAHIEERWCDNPYGDHEYAIRRDERAKVNARWFVDVDNKAPEIAEAAWNALLSKTPVFGALKRRSLKRINWAKNWFCRVVRRVIVQALLWD
jgi:hypothetical protein